MLAKILRFAMDSLLYCCAPMNRRAFTLRPSVVSVTITIDMIMFFTISNIFLLFPLLMLFSYCYCYFRYVCFCCCMMRVFIAMCSTFTVRFAVANTGTTTVSSAITVTMTITVAFAGMPSVIMIVVIAIEPIIMAMFFATFMSTILFVSFVLGNDDWYCCYYSIMVMFTSVPIWYPGWLRNELSHGITPLLLHGIVFSCGVATSRA